MRVHVVTLRYAPTLGGFDERPLAEFVRDKEVLAVREHFFSVHDLPHLACLITYQEGALPRTLGSESTGTRPSNEHKDADPFLELSEADRALCITLRQWRAERMRKDGVPAYVVLTNRQIIAIVKARPQTPNALLGLEGIGPGKVARYGAAILERLNGAAAAKATPPAPAAPAGPPAAAAP